MSYVALCTGVLANKQIPENVDPEWFEIFGIAQRGVPEQESHAERFLRFKLFCGAVAAKFLLVEPGLDTVVIVVFALALGAFLPLEIRAPEEGHALQEDEAAHQHDQDLEQDN